MSSRNDGDLAPAEKTSTQGVLSLLQRSMVSKAHDSGSPESKARSKKSLVWCYRFGERQQHRKAISRMEGNPKDDKHRRERDMPRMALEDLVTHCVTAVCIAWTLIIF